MKISLFGTPQIQTNGEAVPTFKTAKAEGLFYYLAITRQPHSRASLANLFWGEFPETKARSSLSKAISELRKQVPNHVTIDRQTVAFVTNGACWVDVNEFRELSLNVADPTEQLTKVTKLCRGEFLAGFQIRNSPEFERWIALEREQLNKLAAQSFLKLAEEAQRRGQLITAENALRRLLELEPWHEEAHRELMLLLAQGGRLHDAIKQYERCREALTDELDAEPSPKTVALFEDIRNGTFTAELEDVQTAQLVVRSNRSSDDISHNLPHQPTRFIGRQSEIKSICAQLSRADDRLLTLIGPGGIGKTRLAIEIAKAFMEGNPTDAGYRFSDGLYFVPLMAVDSEAGIVAAMADAVGFAFYSDAPPKRQLFNYLKNRQLLLILDNFEQLVDESLLLSELLSHCPKLKIVVTSRQTIPLREAHQQTVQGLCWSEMEDASKSGAKNPETEKAETKDDAFLLFVAAAQRTDSAFSAQSQAESIQRICALVDGMPLALELAASWTSVLTCEQITGQLSTSLDILETDAVDMPAPHSSMRTVFERSWGYLSKKEQQVLAGLSHFQGGFDLDAAQAVAGASLRNVMSLLDRSLVQFDQAGRYQLHELLRQFAAEKLAEWASWHKQVSEHHSQYYLTLMANVRSQIVGREQQSVLVQLQPDVDNVRTAWLLAIRNHDDLLAENAIDTLFYFFFYRHRNQEFLDLLLESKCTWAATVDKRFTDNHSLARRISTRQGVLYYHLGNHKMAEKLLEVTLSTFDPIDDSIGYAAALRTRGLMTGWHGRNTESISDLKESFTISQRFDDKEGILRSLNGLSNMHNWGASYKEGLRYAKMLSQFASEFGRDDVKSNSEQQIGEAHRCLGNYVLSLRSYRNALQYSQKTGNRDIEALATGGIGKMIYALDHTQLPKALELLKSSQKLCEKNGDQRHVATRYFWIGHLLLDSGDPCKAYTYFSQFYDLCVEHGYKGFFSSARYLMAACKTELDALTMARQLLHESTELQLQNPEFQISHLAIYFGRLLEREAEKTSADIAHLKRKQALQLVGTALCLPCWYEYHEKGTALLERLEAFFTDKQLTAMRIEPHDSVQSLKDRLAVLISL